MSNLAEAILMVKGTVTNTGQSISDNLDDIQGLVVRGYRLLPAACFQLLSINDGVAVKKWLALIVDEIQNASHSPDNSCLNIAFTHRGLKKLGLQKAWLNQFSREFIEDIVSPHRQRILGDTGDSNPSQWQWGGPDNDPVDLLLMFYAKDDVELDRLYQHQASRFAEYGLTAFADSKLETTLLPEGKEHFGFRDGISQPRIAGFGSDGPDWNNIEAGEFILGYPNEYKLYTERPLIDSSDDRNNLLADDLEGGHTARKKDLGRNGSYLVFRQIDQHVDKFWQYMDGQAQGNGNGNQEEIRERLAAKMVGRWRDGTPLVPPLDKPKYSTDNANNFLYRHEDRHGTKCPFGAHIRRSNPRDMLDPRPGTEDSIEINKRHRILRRGRAYGDPVTPTLDPNDILQVSNDGEERGLHFICVNANISRQFEFIQHTWANNEKFAGLYDNADPIIGYHGLTNGEYGAFNVPADPVRERYTDIPSFVTVRGGGYFFLPGIRAIKFIASIP